MKSPIWEQSQGALVALINSANAFYCPTLYTINTTAGPVLRITDADHDVTDGTNVWSSRGVRVDVENTKALAHWKRGLDVDTWVVLFLPRTMDPATGTPYPDMIGDVPWTAAASAGALDGAPATVDRAYFAAPPPPGTLVAKPVGILRVFAGRMAEVDTADNLVACTINDWRELLLTNMPRNLFQSGCRFTLYGAGCTLNAAAFATAGVVKAGSTQSTVIATANLNPNTPGNAGTFALGKLSMLTGLNAGFSRTITAWSTGAKDTFPLINPFPFAVEPGDTFDVYPGCNKTTVACADFGNSANFGGMPTIPQSESAI